MQVNRFFLSEADSLRMFAHATTFSDRKKEEEEKSEEREQREEDKRILEIWLYVVKIQEAISLGEKEPFSGSFDLNAHLPNFKEFLPILAQFASKSAKNSSFFN